MPLAERIAAPFRSRTWQHVLAVLFTFVCITALLSVNVYEDSALPSLSVGEVSPLDVQAPRTLEVVNERATKDAREQAAAAVPTVFQYDREVQVAAGRTLEETFNLILKMKAEKNRRTRQLPVRLSDESLKVLLSTETFSLDSLKGLLRTAVDKAMSSKLQSAADVEEARGAAEEILVKARVPGPQRQAAMELAQAVIRPNLRDNYEETIRRRQEAMAHVESVKTLIARGQSIVRKGDLVTPEQLVILQAFGLQKRAQNVFGMLGTALFVCLAIFVVGVYLAQQESPLLFQPRQMWLLILLVILGLGMARGGTQLSPYYAPIATASLLISILLDYRLSLVVTTIMALCVGMMTNSLPACGVAMLTGMVAVLSVTHVTRRSDLMVASLVVWLVNVLAAFVFSLWAGDDLQQLTYNTFVYGLGSGFTAGVVAMGALPFLEAAFNITTHIKLLELSNPSEPLLQRLMVEAPGTYHHSMIVANLADSAARAIGADGLVAKVGAFYHDIGKMKAANFFVENQLGQENPHDRLTPTLSAHIIISHVRDGMEMARQYKVPQVIADFIDMHHGDRLVSFFYHKALQRGEAANESDYRYHGRRPRTRETAIVMMADTIEAKARLLAKPNQENLEKMVRESINNIMKDGQLDDSELSLRDIQTITRAFVKTLMGIYHSRIEYPQMPDTSAPAAAPGSGEGAAGEKPPEHVPEKMS
ncbi:MAG: HDIG domain-containing protein [Armatimonadetes bacterium]|nr:HDIG domain-containing protein [Armatimonadota bacterium]